MRFYFGKPTMQRLGSLSAGGCYCHSQLPSSVLPYHATLEGARAAEPQSAESQRRERRSSLFAIAPATPSATLVAHATRRQRKRPLQRDASTSWSTP